MIAEIEEIPTLTHSLQADMVTGWKPKLKIIGPMPLNFDNPAVDKSIMALIHQESAFYQVVYLGLRPISSFKLHEHLAKHYRYKYAYLLHNDFAHLKPYFQKFYSLFQPQVKRPFHGMNPSLCKKELIFDSCFEGGNLDCAVRLKAQQYDLLLRVDSNTSGHVLWYYFRVTNPQKIKKCVKFNLANLRQNKSAYERGMRPFVRREGREWQQEGENIDISSQKLRYLKQNFTASMEDNQNQTAFFRKMTFEISFQQNQTLQIAYSVPYTYNQLLEDIKDFRKKASILEQISLQINLQNQSLSGLQIPLLKLRSGIPANGKYCIFMIARQHPGESNGSYVIKGVIEQLLSGSEVSMKVLRSCDFVIIPMLNVDGVVAGNFRTSLFGKDLNRLFRAKDTTLIPEVEMARSVLSELSQIYKKKLLLFLDFHGHSTRKNAFVLGPGVMDAQLLNDIRTLPKIMANYTQIFRYPSCSFGLDSSKKTTARALFGRFAGLSYTIETSNWAYYSHQRKMVHQMKATVFEELGENLMRAVEEFVMMRLQARGKFRVKEERKMKSIKSKQDLKDRKSVTTRSPQILLPRTKQLRLHTESGIPEPENEIKTTSLLKSQRPASVEQAISSDQMSENGMDSDSSCENMQQTKFNKYISAASQMLVQFQRVYYGQQYKKGLGKYKMGSSKSNKLLMQKERRKKIEHIQACLRLVDKKVENKLLMAGEQIREIKQKKTIFLEDALVLRESQSKGKNKKREEEISQKKVNQIEPSHRGQIRVGGIIREPFVMTEQLIPMHKFQLLNLQSSNDLKRNERTLQRNERSLQRLRHPPKTNVHLMITHKKQQRISLGLPVIRNSKAILEEGTGSTKNCIEKEKFNDLLVGQQMLNKNVVNVLKLSKLGRSSKRF